MTARFNPRSRQQLSHTQKVRHSVPLKETIAGFEAILEGKVDDLPEQAFYLVGNLDEVRAKAEKLAKS